MENKIYKVRATGILIENNSLLLVQQKLSNNKNWSLPGGRVEPGETLEQALIREMKEETGLDVEPIRMLYVCDVEASANTVLHITFLTKRVGGEITLPTNEFDENPIHDVRFISIDALPQYGFSKKFIELLKNDFPNAGNYMGDKSNIGLGI
ncbi:MAG: NUDIX hydrolase [Roseburia sp.]|nr:NUDIX hydrolase [Roseburia sp.]